MNSKKGALILFMAAAIGGFGFIVMKGLMESGFTPIQCIAGRYIVAVIAMVGFYFRDIKNITKEEMQGGIIMGILLFLLFFLLMEGLEKTTPSINAFLGSTMAIMVPIIVWRVNKVAPDRYVIIGAVMTLVGVGLLSLTEGFGLSIGALLSVGASVMFAIQMVVMDKYVKSCNPARLTIIESFVVMVLAVCSTFISKESIPILKFNTVIDFIIAGVFCTFLYFLFQSIGQKYTSPTSTSIIISSEAVFAALASVIFYGENLSMRVIVGGLLIFLAVVIAEAKPKCKKFKVLTNWVK